MRTILIHNPSAGSAEDAVDPKALADALRGLGHEVADCDRHGAGLGEALTHPHDLLVAMGGDGTVSSVLRAQTDRSVPLAILPSGTANDLARGLGADQEEVDAASLAGRLSDPTLLSRRSFDICVADGAWGQRCLIESAGVGVLADAMRRCHEEEGEPDDPIAHARALICGALRRAEPFGGEVLADGEPVGEGLVLAEILNAPVIGPRLRLAPQARTDDGLLDLVACDADGGARLADWIEAGAEGPPPVQPRRARAVTLRCEGATLRLDDDFSTASDAEVAIRIGSERALILRRGEA